MAVQRLDSGCSEVENDAHERWVRRIARVLPLAVVLSVGLWAESYVGGVTPAVVAAGSTEPAPVQPLGFDEGASTRIASKAERNADVYANADGTFSRVVSSRPVNYRTASGSWEPIDTTLVEGADGRLQVTANSVQVSLSDGGVAARGVANDLVSVTLPGGQVIAYSLEGGASVEPVVDGSTALYRDVLPYTDLELTAFESGGKETLVLESPLAARSWLFPLRLVGVTPRLQADGAVAFLDMTGTAVAWLPRGFMEDSFVELPTGERRSSPDVVYELIESGGGWTLKMTAGSAWLEDPARVYPVRVDPTITTYTTTDAFVDNDTSTPSSTQNGTSLAVGYDNESAARSFIHFDNISSDGVSGTVTEVTLRLWHTWSWDCTMHVPVGVHEVLAPWTDTALGVSAMPGPAISDAIGVLTINDNYPACTNTGGNRSIGAWREVALNTGTFTNWANGGANHGLALTSDEGNPRSWKRFTSSDYSGGAYEPRLIITYNAKPTISSLATAPATTSVNGVNVMNTLTPKLQAVVTDPEAAPLTARFEYRKVGTTSTLAVSGSVASGGTAFVQLPTLVNNTDYEWRAEAIDSLGQLSPMAGWQYFRVQAATFAPGCEANVPGDFNGDGVRDFVIADPFSVVDGVSEAGVVHVVNGSTNAVTDLHQNLASVPGVAGVGDMFGRALAVYDANSDGCSDLAVGVPFEDASPTSDIGEVDLIFGAPGGLGTGPASVQYLQGQSGMPGVAESGDWFGYSLAAGTTVGGEPFLVIGAPGDDVGASPQGGSVSYVRGTMKVSFTQASIGLSAESDDRSGFAVAATGRHFVMSAPGENVSNKGQFSGQVCAFKHNAAAVAPSLVACVHQDSAGVSDDVEVGDEFGKTVAMAPFWPTTDSLLAVGAPGEDIEGVDIDSVADAGIVMQFRITDTAITQVTSTQQTTAGISDTNEAGDRFGETVALVNTNPAVAPTTQTLLLAVGVPGEDVPNAIDAGLLHVFAAGTTTIAADTVIDRRAASLPGAPANRQMLGIALASAGPNLLVASPYSNRAVWALPWSSLAAGTAGPTKTWQPGIAGMPASFAFGVQVG